MYNFKNNLHALSLMVTTTTLVLGGISPNAIGQIAERDRTSTMMEEIVVTAQRREERLVDVPISITALTPEFLENAGISNSFDLDLVTPGLTMPRSGIAVQPAIRGVTSSTGGLSEANVATYIDGVYQAALVASMYELPDVQSIQVLKGPQGTLFGRNSTGGAILINTLDPDLQEMTGSVALGYSSFDTSLAKGFVSVPVAKDKVAFSLAGFYEDMSDGYIDDLVNGGNTGEVQSELVRGKLRFVPWEGADFTLAAMYSNRDDGSFYSRTNWEGNNRFAGLAASQGLPFADEPHEVSGDKAATSDTEINSISLRGELQMGPGILTITTGYVDHEAAYVLDSDAIPMPLVVQSVDQKIKTFSQELVYATEQIGRFRAIGGLYYFDSDGDFSLNVNDYLVALWFNDTSEAYAAFGELTFDLTDRVSITGGLRYSNEKVESFSALTGGGISERPPLPELGSETWDSFDPRLSIVYELRDDANVYFTYSQGFKSGLFNSGSLQVQPVDPEEIDAYELGFKGRLRDSLSLNAAVFYYDYTDLHQVSRHQVDGLAQQILQNVATAEIWGVEIGGAWLVTDAFMLSFGGQYLHAEYEDFPGATVVTPVTQTMRVQENIDASGKTMIRAPEWTGTLTAQYTKEFQSGTYTFATTLFASSKVYYESANRVEDPAYEKLNASFMWEPVNSGLKFKIWGRNLTDSDTIASTTITSTYDAFVYEPPRSYGVEIGYKF